LGKESDRGIVRKNSPKNEEEKEENRPLFGCFNKIASFLIMFYEFSIHPVEPKSTKFFPNELKSKLLCSIIHGLAVMSERERGITREIETERKYNE
jgi:hypothetical protein